MHIRKYGFHIALIVIIITGVSLSCIVLLYTANEKFTLVGIIIAIATFLFDRIYEHKKNNDEINERLSRVCKALKVEVNKLDKWHNSDEYQAYMIKGYIPEFLQKIEYTEILIDKSPYDGILNSGLITYLGEETQDKLNTYYFYVDAHNKRMFSLVEIYNDKASSPEFKFEDIGKLRSSLAWKLNISELTKYEKKMHDMVDELKRLLDDEIKNAGGK